MLTARIKICISGVGCCVTNTIVSKWEVTKALWIIHTFIVVKCNGAKDGNTCHCQLSEGTEFSMVMSEGCLRSLHSLYVCTPTEHSSACSLMASHKSSFVVLDQEQPIIGEDPTQLSQGCLTALIYIL